MYTFDPIKATPLYQDKIGHGFKITDIPSALKSIDFNKIEPFHKHMNVHNTNTVDISSLQEGNLAFVQKGKRKRMSTPFIVEHVEHNPNENTESIGIDFVSTRDNVHDVHLYAQLPEDPSTMGASNFYKDAQYISARDEGFTNLADNGNLWIIPDEYIMRQLAEDIAPQDGLHLII